MTDNNSEFYNDITLNLHKIVSKSGSCDVMVVSDLLERGKHFIMTWLKDEEFRKLFEGEPMMYYYNVACIAFGGGVAYADAFEKDVSQVKLGFVDTLLASEKNITALAQDILNLQTEDEKDQYQQTLGQMFSYFVEAVSPYWETEDPRPFLFQGLMAFFQTGISFRLN